MNHLYLHATTPPDPQLSIGLDGKPEGFPCFCVYVHKPQGRPAYACASLGHKTPNSYVTIFDTKPRPGVRVGITGPATLAKKRAALNAVLDWLEINCFVTPEALTAARAAVAQATEITA
jgi:hypothetical protein